MNKKVTNEPIDLDADEPIDLDEEETSEEAGSSKDAPRKGFHLNLHVILIAVICLIAVIAGYRLYRWNQGGISAEDEVADVDPSEFDIETLDMIIPMDASALEGHEDDGVTTILCLGNNPFSDDRDSTGLAAQLASKTGDDATNEFATGKAVFYQNGSWAYSDLVKAGMTDDQIGMMPIYIGVDGEENQGLCSGGENYWCVSSQASEDAQKATEDFMYWCVTADTPTSIIADKMGLTAPFKSAKETTNVFSQQAVAMAKDGKKTVAWDFVYIPSEEWKKNLKQALIAYAADNTKWDGVKNAFVDGWKTEKAASE